MSKKSAIETFIREMGKLFSIEDVRFYAAEGMGVFSEKKQEILRQTLNKMTNIKS